MMINPLVIKLGGTLLNDEHALQQLFSAIAKYKQTNNRMIVIVHGGGCFVDDLMKRLNLSVVKLQGLRVTPADHIDIVVGLLAGTANKILLAAAKKYKLPAIGLCLSDGDSAVVQSASEELGYVGRSYCGNGKLLHLLSSANYLSIVSSIGITETGDLLNVNSDDAAVSLAKTLNADLLMLSRIGGVLDENKNYITEINIKKAQALIASGVITGGMAIKVQAASTAVEQLNKEVSIAGMQHAEQLVELFNGKGSKTTVVI